jgi:hypothetical protein
MERSQWLTVAVGIAGIVATWFFARYYYRPERRRIPTFVVSKTRALLCRPELFQVEGMSVLHDQKPLPPTPISELLIYFWNSGTLPILKSEVLEPFSINISHTIFQFKLLKTSRPVVGLRVVEGGDGELIIDFDVLEAGDGATISIVYAGEGQEPTLKFVGTCLGVAKPTVLPPEDFYFQSRWQRFQSSSLFPVPFFLLFFLVLAGARGVLDWISRSYPWLHLAAIGNGLFVFLIVLMAIGALIGGGVSASDFLKKFRAAHVPPEIKPPRS